MAQAVFGSIVGTVTDSTNAAIPRAKVTVRDVGKGISYSTLTNDAGNYSQTHLIVGVYEVRVEAAGFAAYVQQNVNVEVDANTQVNAELHPGTVGEVVNVTGEAPLLKTERSDVSDTVTQKAVAELPVFSRDVSRLYFLVPGVQASGTTAASEQPQDIYRPSIGGQYWGGISFQLDGTDNRESVLGEPVITPNLDAVSELKITTTAYDAEFGQASQAVISAQTKSGTNAFHGGGFWYRRDQHGPARDPFAQSQPIAGSTSEFIPPTLWNQFGGSLGGPIQKDKTFFFGDYQGTAQKNGGSLLTRVPNAAERNGDLSDLGTAIFNPCNGANCNIDPSARQQFAGGVIPANLLSPQAEALLAYLPLPNVVGATGANPNYAASGAGIVNWNGFDAPRGSLPDGETTHVRPLQLPGRETDQSRSVRPGGGRTHLCHDGVLRRGIAARPEPLLRSGLRDQAKLADRFPLRFLPLPGVREPERAGNLARQGRRRSGLEPGQLLYFRDARLLSAGHRRSQFRIRAQCELL